MDKGSLMACLIRAIYCFSYFLRLLNFRLVVSWFSLPTDLLFRQATSTVCLPCGKWMVLFATSSCLRDGHWVMKFCVVCAGNCRPFYNPADRWWRTNVITAIHPRHHHSTTPPRQIENQAEAITAEAQQQVHSKSIKILISKQSKQSSSWASCTTRCQQMTTRNILRSWNKSLQIA